MEANLPKIPNFESKDYYEILGLPRDADEDIIRKTYKKYVKEYHPDRNIQDKEKAAIIFKKITEAYEVLSDPQKRQAYDRFGHNPPTAGVSMDAFDILSSMFGGSFNFGNFGNLGNTGGPRGRVRPLEHSVYLDLKTIYKGKKVKLNIERKHIFTIDNQPVDPNRYQNYSEICSHCKGQGQTIHVQPIGPGMVRQHSAACGKCMGTGYGLKSGYIIKDIKETISIDVPPGTLYETRFEIPNKGDMLPGCKVADLHLYVLEKVDPIYRRQGQDIHTEHWISLGDALYGKEIYFTHLDERILRLCHNSMITPDMVKKIDGEGLPYPGGNKRGDLYLTFKIRFPKASFINKLTSGQRKELENILPKSKMMEYTSTINMDK